MANKKTIEAPSEMDRLLTLPELAHLLHVSRALIYSLIRSGDLPTVHIGHALRFRWDDVQAYIRQRAEVRSARALNRKSGRLRAGKRDR